MPSEMKVQRQKIGACCASKKIPDGGSTIILACSFLSRASYVPFANALLGKDVRKRSPSAPRSWRNFFRCNFESPTRNSELLRLCESVNRNV